VSSPLIIKNKLEVVGSMVKVPGFEPLSEQTTNSLSIALQGASTYISLDKAMALIPGSKLLITYNGGPTAGSFGHNMFLELPSGPPPDGNSCPSNCIRDYYKILRDAARLSLTPLERPNLAQECNQMGGFGDSSCDFNEFEQGLM
jgi:hypothetical protein